MSLKKAYLILAHHQPDHLARLIRRLSDGYTAFYVHIDRRADIDQFFDVTQRPDVTVVPRRRVNWMGFSVVLATLDLLRSAVCKGFDAYTLLSGSDYPVKSNLEIESALKYNANCINFWKLSDRPSWQHKVQYYFPIDFIPIHYRRCSPFSTWFWRRFFWYRHRFSKRKFLEGLEPWGGSQWWTLSHEIAQHVLNFIDGRPDYTAFFRFTESPDELFFQTIIMNSPMSGRVRMFEEYVEWSESTPAVVKAAENTMLAESKFNLRYIDWSGCQGAERGTPAILDDRDLRALRNTDCLFARKFDSTKSRSLLDQLDQNLLN